MLFAIFRSQMFVLFPVKTISPYMRFVLCCVCFCSFSCSPLTLPQESSKLNNIPCRIKTIQGHRWENVSYNGSWRIQTERGGDRRGVCGEGHTIKRCLLAFRPCSAQNITGSAIQIIHREPFIHTAYGEQLKGRKSWAAPLYWWLNLVGLKPIKTQRHIFWMLFRLKKQSTLLAVISLLLYLWEHTELKWKHLF